MKRAPAVQETEEEEYDPLSDSSERAENVSIYFTSTQWQEMGDYERERCRNRLQNHYLSLAIVEVPDKPDFMLAAEKRWAREQKLKERRIKSILHKRNEPENNTKSAKSKAKNKKCVWFEIDGPRPKENEIESDCNVRGIQGGEQVLTKAVNPGTELLVHYSDDYAKHINKRFPTAQNNVKGPQRSDGRKFACQLCDHVAKSSKLLNKHEREVHRGAGRDHIATTEVCPHCNKTFTLGYNLQRHLRTHTGGKRFACDVCAKGFTQKGDLKKHQLIHSGEQPFACQECARKFNQISSLKTHQRIHTGEKPHKCKWCDKRFSDRSNLTVHERRHTGEKPYQCQMCSRRFTTSGSLRTHELCGPEKGEGPAVQEQQEEGHNLLKDSCERAENVSIYFTSSQWKEMGDYERERCRNRLQYHYLSLATVLVPDKPDFMLAAELRWAQEQKLKERRIKSILHKRNDSKSNTKSAKSKANKRKRVWFEIDGPRPKETEKDATADEENKETSAPPPKKKKEVQFVSPGKPPVKIPSSAASQAESSRKPLGMIQVGQTDSAQTEKPHSGGESSVSQSASSNKTADSFSDQKGAKLKPQFPQPSKLQSIKSSAQTDRDMMQFSFGPDPEIRDKPFIANLSSEFQHCSTISAAKAKLILENAAVVKNENVCMDGAQSDQQSVSVDVAASSPSPVPSSTRYPRRARKAVNYAELDSGAVQLREADDDDFEHVWCYGCKDFAHGGCKEHLMLFVFDNPTAVSGTRHYCTQSVPSFLSVSPSKYKEAGLGVWVNCHLPAGVAFGPYRGRLCTNAKEADKSGYSWEIIKEDQPTSRAKRFFIDGADMDISNWMRFVNCGYKESDCNVRGIQGGEQVWYVLTKAVNPGTELLVHYGDDYVKHINKTFSPELGKTPQLKVKETTDMFSCSQCDLAFTTDDLLQEHTRRAHEGRKFPCPVCDHVAKSSWNLNNHERQVHRGEGRDHVCPHCDKTFNRAGLLENHLRTHTGEKPFGCNVCARRFSEKASLKKHKLIHSGEQPFACKECGQSFGQLSHLKTHQRIHTGEKPYKCQWCDKRFNQSSNLTDHERTHTGEKPYECQMCSSRFTTSGNLRVHERKVHNM